MRFQHTLYILLAVAVLGAFTPNANANVSVVTARMDVIIKQMEALKLELAQLASAVGTTPSGSVLGVSTSKPVFTQSLANGETNDDIKRIQKLLATDPEIYPYGVASGFYGPKTEEAIKNLQTRFNLDPVGVVGPATTALLELFMNAYPDGNYPANVLSKKPEVKGVSTSIPQLQLPVTPIFSSGALIEKITAQYDGDEAEVKISYSNKTSSSFIVEGEKKIEIVEAVAAKLGRTKADILGLIDFTNLRNNDKDDDDFEVEVEIDDDETIITFEFEGDEYEIKVDGTDEDDILEEVADELDVDEDDVDEDLWEAIEDALDEALEDEDDKDSDEIDSIKAKIANGEAEVEVEYGDGDEEEFTVEEDYEPAIIREIADELDMDEDDVEDIIKFKYEDVDEINVEIKNGKALAFVTFEDGTKKRIRVNSDDEDEIIEAIAEELDEDEDDVEDWTNFDYVD